MSFREIFEKYINGTASEEEISLVLEEIEKNELISNYVAEELSFSFPEEEESTEENTKKIRKAVNRKIFRVALTILGAIVAFLLVCFLVLSPLVSSFYCDPTEVVLKKDDTPFYPFATAASVYSELNMPGAEIALYAQDPTNLKKKGFGVYDVSYDLIDRFNYNRSATISATLSRGKFVNRSSDSFYYFGILSQFSDSKDSYGKLIQDSFDLANKKEELQALPRTAQVKAYITYRDLLNMEQQNKIWLENPEVRFHWIAVKCDQFENHIDNIRFGFNPEPYGNNSEFFSDHSINLDMMEQYPDLNFIFTPYNQQDKEGFFTRQQAFANHFQSLLQFSIDYPDFTVAMHNGAEDMIQRYKQALSYVKENGIQTYGCLVSGSVEDILTLLDNDMIGAISLEDIRLSKYTRY